MARFKSVIPVLASLACFVDSPTEPPLAIPGQVSVSLAISSAELEAGETIDLMVRVQNHSRDRVAYSYGAPPFTIEFLDQVGGSALLHPANRFAIRVVHVLGPGEVAETRYPFDGHVWTGGASAQSYRLPPGTYHVVARLERRSELRSAPIPLEVH